MTAAQSRVTGVIILPWVVHSDAGSFRYIGELGGSRTAVIVWLKQFTINKLREQSSPAPVKIPLTFDKN